jgi:hypothetical protein
MVTVNRLSPDYNHQGELHTTDENGIPLVILCYVQEQPIMGHDTFILLSNNTIVDSNIDINHHAKTSKEVGAVPLKRLKSSPYHHMDTYSANKTKDDSITLEDNAFDTKHLAMHAAFDAKAQHLQHTGKRLRHSTKALRKWSKAQTTELWLSSEWDPAFMSEITLQGLLDRTKADEQDEEAMDMTVINGMHMSKYDIRALKVGQKVTTQMRNDLAEFNKNFVGENSVFPVKNEAPRILTQFKEDPYVAT